MQASFAVLDAISPESDSMLTKKNANFVLLQALLDGADLPCKSCCGRTRTPARTTHIRR
jgi:hypothetical protein